jgi:hypothetical protein
MFFFNTKENKYDLRGTDLIYCFPLFQLYAYSDPDFNLMVQESQEHIIKAKAWKFFLDSPKNPEKIEMLRKALNRIEVK